MSISLTTDQTLSLQSAAQTAARAAETTSAAAAASASSGTAAGSSGNALASLSGNYTDFLQMFTTQLQNQDPDSPMSSDELTTELVQFSGVEQQIQVNSSLSTLIGLSQDSQLSESSGLVGKPVDVAGSTVALQSGRATLDYTTTQAEPVAVSITNSSGLDVKDVLLNAASGANTYTWDGTDNAGNALPDGAYSVAIEASNGSAAPSVVPFTSVATPTGVQRNGSALDVDFGAATIDLSNVEGLASASP